MKILITGKDSYIGTSFENFIKNYDGYETKTLDMLNPDWRSEDFSEYDVVFHVAGIAHADVNNVSEEVKERYYSVNTNLTAEVAEKAKREKVKQFIFMSSMIVFGSDQERINTETKPNPDSFYGDSKLRADIKIQSLNDENFSVASLRPPMIYGKGCKGNYPLLAKFAKKMPLFPNYENERSMLYIENLCMFIKMVIDNGLGGYFYPQNKEYVTTSDMVKIISKTSGSNIRLTKFFNPFIKLMKKNGYIKKVFGSRCYEKNMSDYYNFDYCVCDFEESIRRTEMG